MTEPQTGFSTSATGGDDITILDNPFSHVTDLFESTNGSESQTETPLSEEPTDSEIDQEETKEEPTEEQTEELPVEESEEEAVETQEEEPEAESEATEEDVATFDMKVNGEDVEVPETATIKIKVDGKTKLVSVKDLVIDYNGRVVWASKFSDLGRQKKALETEKAQFVQQAQEKAAELNNVVKQLENKNPLGAIIAIANLQGLNAKEQVANFIVQADKTVREWLETSPEGRKQLLDAIELEQYKQRELKQTKQKEVQTKAQQFWTDTENLVLSKGFTMDEFREASNFLIEHQSEIFPQNANEEQIRDIILDRLSAVPVYVEIEDVASKVNSQKFKSFSKEAKQEFLDEMFRLKQAGIWRSASELKDILSEVLGKPAPKKASSLVSQKSATKTAKTLAPKGSEQKKPLDSVVDDILNQIRDSEITTTFKPI